jgi:LuxR family maltose regulon positive regulatory protein
VVERPRLVELVRRGLRGPFTLVTAPAGYGKSVLVRAWEAEDRPSGVVHTRLTEAPSSAAYFWAMAIEEMRRAGVDLQRDGATGAGDRSGPRTLARVAERIRAHGRPLVWVLDCGEHSLPRAVTDGLDRLMSLSGGALHLVLTTRIDPLLPLHRYRLDDAITEIRAADLAFSADETSALMQQAGLALAPRDVDKLRTRTGGWPAGLRFAAMSLAGRADIEHAIDAFRGDTDNVAEYLMSEVLATQPAAVRELLLRTCVVDELQPGVVEALTGDHCDARVLRFLAHGNSFIEPVQGSDDRYHYQPLFREFLRSQLAFERPALVPELHRAAAEWYAQHGQLPSAISHAALGEDWAMAARFVVNGFCYASELSRRQPTPLPTVLAHLPADLEVPEAGVTRALFALRELDADRAASELALAGKLLERDGRHLPQPCALAVVVLDAVVAGLGEDPEAGLTAAVAAESALHLQPVHDPVAHAELAAIVAGCKARMLLQLGRFGPARDVLAAGVKAAHAQDLDGAVAELQGLAALVNAMAGNLREALGVARRLVTTADGAGNGLVCSSRAAALAFAWVRLDEYELTAAHDLLRCAEELAPSYDAKVLHQVETLLKARLLAAQDELDLARAELQAVLPGQFDAPVRAWLDRSLLADLAALLMAQGDAEGALATLGDIGGCDHIECSLAVRRAWLAAGSGAEVAMPSRPAQSRADPLAVRVGSWLARAMSELHDGDAAAAQGCLESALHLAAPEHLRRPFLEAPDEIRQLLDRGKLAAGHRWLQVRVPAARAGSASSAAPEPGEHRQPRESDVAAGQAPIVIPLTKKEQEVLGYLAELLTTEEIASTMFVSVNTVRSHVRSILRKLGVTRRNEAVRRAWELRLLPSPNAA